MGNSNIRKSFYFILPSLAFIAIAFNNCGGFESAGQGDNASKKDVPPGTGSIVIAPSVAKSSLELADKKVVSVSVTSIDGFTGALDLKIESPEIDALDKLNGFSASISPSSVTLSNGETVSVDVTLDTNSLAASLAEHVHIVAYKSGTALIENEAELNVEILPIFRVKIKGTGDANWFVDGQDLATTFNNRAAGIPTFNFVHHNAGVQVIFENYDTATHIIHSSGSINHQDTTKPMAASADGTTVGGNYSPTPIIGTAASNASLYLHDTENNNARRILNFNVDL